MVDFLFNGYMRNVKACC